MSRVYRGRMTGTGPSVQNLPRAVSNMDWQPALFAASAQLAMERIVVSRPPSPRPVEYRRDGFLLATVEPHIHDESIVTFQPNVYPELRKMILAHVSLTSLVYPGQ